MNRNRLIMGSALTLATLAVAIDHTRHRLPEPVRVQQDMEVAPAGGDMEASPCGLAGPCSLVAPCSLDGPCGLEDSPCAMSPCSLSDSPCSMSPCSL